MVFFFPRVSYIVACVRVCACSSLCVFSLFYRECVCVLSVSWMGFFHLPRPHEPSRPNRLAPAEPFNHTSVGQTIILYRKSSVLGSSSLHATDPTQETCARPRNVIRVRPDNMSQMILLSTLFIGNTSVFEMSLYYGGP